MNADKDSFTHVFCHECGDIKQARVDEIATPSLDSKFIGGDICCAECLIIIATVFKLRD